MIPYWRFQVAVERLALRRLARVARDRGPLSEAEREALMRRVCVPYAGMKMAKRCWRRDMEIEFVSPPEGGFW